MVQVTGGSAEGEPWLDASQAEVLHRVVGEIEVKALSHGYTLAQGMVRVPCQPHKERAGQPSQGAAGIPSRLGPRGGHGGGCDEDCGGSRHAPGLPGEPPPG
jgi:hypothetical protein